MKKISISPIDTLFVNGSYPIEMLFYYKNKLNTKELSNALKRLSSPFWPLFGIYNGAVIQSAKYIENNFLAEIIYNKDFNSACDEMTLWESFNQVNPAKMEGLFFLSVLQFKNGTVIIPKMNHLAGDGYSYFYFLSVLAELTKPSNVPLKKTVIRLLAAPHLKRTPLKPFHFNKTKIEQPFKHTNCTIQIEKVKKSSVKQQIKIIKASHNKIVSTNDLLSAIVFKRIFEKQKSQIDSTFTLTIPIDVRRQVKELGQKYFGNAIMMHNLQLSADEIEKISIEKLAVKLRKSMPIVNSNNYLEYQNDLESQMEQTDLHTLKPYNPETGCLVTNLSRMLVQKLNFGTGNPDFIFPLTIGKNSTVILADIDNFVLRLVD